MKGRVSFSSSLLLDNDDIKLVPTTNAEPPPPSMRTYRESRVWGDKTGTRRLFTRGGSLTCFCPVLSWPIPHCRGKDLRQFECRETRVLPLKSSLRPSVRTHRRPFKKACTRSLMAPRSRSLDDNR